MRIAHGGPLLAALVFSGVALGGCYTKTAGNDLAVRVAAVESRQSQFTATFDDERQRLTELALRAEEQIDELEAALNQAQAFLQRTNADLGVRVDGQESDINSLRGSVEEAMFQNAQLRQELELLRQDIEIQLEALLSQ